MNALLDKGFLLAVIDKDDSLHVTCATALQNENGPLLPDVVLPELAYPILRNLGYGALIGFLRSVTAGEIALTHATKEDIERASGCSDRRIAITLKSFLHNFSPACETSTNFFRLWING